MAKLYRCTIVTPSEAVVDDDVSYVSFPAWDGQQGVMHSQSPLLCRLGIGPLKIQFADGTSRRFLVDGGFAQIRDNTLTIITERAEPAESISREDAESELAAANARAVTGGTDRAQAEADQQRARVKLALTASSER